MKTKLFTIAMMVALLLAAITRGQAQEYDGPCLPPTHGLDDHRSAFCGSTETQTIALVEGYNWVSLSVGVEDPIEMLDQLKAALGDKGITIEGNGVGTEYLGDGEWIGDLDYEGMYNEQMYLIQVSEDCTVELAGTPIVDPTLHVIDIYPGYNWIGFPYSEELDVNEALMGFEALDEDMIESPEGISYYFGEWMGDVMTLVPGQGYLYFSNSEDQKTLVIQTGGAKARAKVVSPK